MQNNKVIQGQQPTSGGLHRKNKKSHYVVSDTGNILEMPGTIQGKQKL